MNRVGSLLLLSCLIAVDTSNGQEKPRRGFLSVLHEGQSVVVKEVGGRFEITLLKDVKVGQKLIEIGSDYIVVEDVIGTETRLHVTSIKSITRLKLPEK